MILSLSASVAWTVKTTLFTGVSWEKKYRHIQIRYNLVNLHAYPTLYTQARRSSHTSLIMRERTVSSANTGELSFSLRISTMILYTLCNSSKNNDMFEWGLAGGRFTGKKMEQGVPEVRRPHNTRAQPSGQDPEPE